MCYYFRVFYYNLSVQSIAKHGLFQSTPQGHCRAVRQSSSIRRQDPLVSHRRCRRYILNNDYQSSFFFLVSKIERLHDIGWRRNNKFSL